MERDENGVLKWTHAKNLYRDWGSIKACLKAFSLTIAICFALVLSLIAAPITALLSMMIAYLVVKRKFVGKGFMEFVTMFAMAVPGTVLGIALLRGYITGLFGSGSECFGYDDVTSQDHDFEPGFCIFLPGEDVVSRRDAFLLEQAEGDFGLFHSDFRPVNRLSCRCIHTLTVPAVRRPG